MVGTEYLIKSDKKLEQIIAQLPVPTVESTELVFHDLMSCVLEQQIHYRSTKRIFQKMLDRANLDILTVENFEDFEKAAFEGIKLSMKKYETVANVVDYFKNHQTDWKALSDDEVREELSTIKGIGPWTKDMILLYTLKRPNIFPYGDFHLKKIMIRLYGLDPSSKLKRQMLKVAETWSPHQSLAVLYLLDWKKLKKG